MLRRSLIRQLKNMSATAVLKSKKNQNDVRHTVMTKGQRIYGKPMRNVDIYTHIRVVNFHCDCDVYSFQIIYLYIGFQ